MHRFLLIAFLVILGMIQSSFSQTQKLDYKVRSFNIGLNGSFGFSHPLDVEHLSGINTLTPVYPIFNELATDFFDYMGNPIEARANYSLGGSFSYRHSMGSKFLMSLGGGYTRTQTTQYFVNDVPYRSRSHPFTDFHDWYNVEHLFLSLHMSVPLGNKRGRFFNFGANIGQANVSDPLFDRDVRDYPGITESGTRTWVDILNDEGFSFIDVIQEDVLVLTPRISFLILSGKYNQNAFEFALSYSFNLSEDLIQTQYIRFQQNELVESQMLHYGLDQYALEMSYSIPLFKSKNPIGKKREKKIREKPIKPAKPSTGPPVVKDESYRAILPSLQNCYGQRDTRVVKFQENPFFFTDNMVEFEIYHSDGGNDGGDIVSICQDGTILRDQLTLTDKGNLLRINTLGKQEINLLVYSHSDGTQGNTSLGIGLMRGGQVRTEELSPKEGEYLWFRLLRK